MSHFKKMKKKLYSKCVFTLDAKQSKTKLNMLASGCSRHLLKIGQPFIHNFV